MKFSKILFSILLIALIWNTVIIYSFANDDGFSTEALTEDEINRVLNNTKITFLSEEPTREAIDCFDVDENGMFAVGFSNYKQKKVSVYTEKCEFAYGYSFETTGDFGIELDGQSLNIYFVRSDVFVTLSDGGDIVEIKKIQNTIENNDYWNKQVNLTERNINNTKYVLKNDSKLGTLFATSYSKLVTINAAGEESVLFDAHIESGSYWGVFILSLLFNAIVIGVVVYQVIKHRRKWAKGEKKQYSIN